MPRILISDGSSPSVMARTLPESDKQPNRSLFNGLAQAIIQSTKKPGDIQIEVRASSEGWVRMSSKITITSKPVELRPSVPVV